jgi:hypothetical protein
MYGVQCPKCQSILKTQRELSNVKLKCSRCGNVFSGSTAPLDAPAPARPPEPPRSKPAARPVSFAPRKRSPVPLIVVSICGLGALLALVLIIYNTTHTKITDQYGNVLAVGSKSDAQKLEEQEKERKQAAEKAAADERAQREAQRQAAKAAATPGPAPAAPDVPGAAAKTPAAATTAPAAAPVPKLAADKSLVVMTGTTIASDTGDGGFIIGTLHNTNEYTMKTVKVTVRLFDQAGKVRQSPSVTLDYIPPKGVVPFAVQYYVGEDDFKEMDVAATGEKDETKTGWMIDATSCTMRREGDFIVLTGRTSNPMGVRVNNAKIYCDFYSGDGIYAGAASPPGKLTGDSPNIGVSQASDFEVRFNAAGAKRVLPDSVRNWAPRVIGDVR